MLKKTLIGIVKVYNKLVSPFTIRSCRFHPSCSGYACEAIEHYGPLKAAPRIAWRILRCNPFSKGGYDPVIKKEMTYE